MDKSRARIRLKSNLKSDFPTAGWHCELSNCPSVWRTQFVPPRCLITVVFWHWACQRSLVSQTVKVVLWFIFLLTLLWKKVCIYLCGTLPRQNHSFLFQAEARSQLIRIRQYSWSGHRCAVSVTDKVAPWLHCTVYLGARLTACLL